MRHFKGPEMKRFTVWLKMLLNLGTYLLRSSVGKSDAYSYIR